MGNTCQPDAVSPTLQQNQNLPGSRLRNPKNISNMPRSSYAYQVNQPDLNSNISATLNDLMYRSSFKNENQQSPFFYIISKKAFYQGGFNSQRLPQGKGIAIFQDGTYYQGNFINGQAQDQKGLIIFPNGGYYIGNISNSTMNGKGKFTHRNVYSYDGQWDNGAPNGNGIETYQQDKIKYKGSFVSGFKQGKGEYSWDQNNNKYVGKFQNGLMNDNKGTIESKGSKFTGNFVDGRRQGYGVVTTNNGALQGQFVDDQINGKGKFVWQDGKVYQGQFKKSQFHGPGKIIYPNKKIVQGQWRQNHNLMVSKIL